MLHQLWLVQTQNLAQILVSAEIPFVNLNLSRNSAEPKISDLRKISAEIWLRLETFRESGPRCSLFAAEHLSVEICEIQLPFSADTTINFEEGPSNLLQLFV